MYSFSRSNCLERQVSQPSVIEANQTWPEKNPTPILPKSCWPNLQLPPDLTRLKSLVKNVLLANFWWQLLNVVGLFPSSLLSIFTQVWQLCSGHLHTDHLHNWGDKKRRKNKEFHLQLRLQLFLSHHQPAVLSLLFLERVTVLQIIRGRIHHLWMRKLEPHTR